MVEALEERWAARPYSACALGGLIKQKKPLVCHARATRIDLTGRGNWSNDGNVRKVGNAKKCIHFPSGSYVHGGSKYVYVEIYKCKFHFL